MRALWGTRTVSAWHHALTLAGRHVTLRPLSRDDRTGLLDAFAGLQHLFTTTVPNEGTIGAWFDDLDRQRAAERVMPFAVLDADGRVSGTTRFMRMAPRHGRLEIGGTLYAPRVQRTGLNTEAKLLLLGYSFEVLHAGCVQLRTDFLNHASRRAIERLGARQDGVLRGHMMMGEHLRDTVVYSILRHEWPGVRRNLAELLEKYG